jgi:hypothetical protein
VPWEVRYAYPGRIPFQSWVTPVPRFSDQLPKICVYLYPDKQNATTGDAFGGSGFVVGLQSSAFPDRQHSVVITNRHVAEGYGTYAPSPVLRVNRKGGLPPRILDLSVHDWIVSDIDDLAIYPCEFDGSEDVFKVGEHMFATDTDYKQFPLIGIGDDVMFVGRFMPHENAPKGALGGVPGASFNEPTVRFGHVSLIPKEPIKSDTGKSQKSILIEARSIPGYSGSPVFFYQQYNVNPRNRVVDVREMKLIGVDWGHLLRAEQGKMRDLTTEHPADVWVETSSGMMCIVPAQHLRRFLDEPRIQEWRTAMDAKWKDEQARAARCDAVNDAD